MSEEVRCQLCGKVIPNEQQICFHCAKEALAIPVDGNRVLHELKLNINFCDAVHNGQKNFEIRRNDRGFQTGDFIRFTPVRSAVKAEDMYPEHPIKDDEFMITYIMNGYGLDNGFVVLGIKKL